MIFDVDTSLGRPFCLGQPEECENVSCLPFAHNYTHMHYHYIYIYICIHTSVSKYKYGYEHVCLKHVDCRVYLRLGVVHRMGGLTVR